MDYDDPNVVERWCSERQAEVATYMQRERVAHGRIGEWPAWHVAPYVSVWAIESKSNPGWVGWWAISGDLPTDYVSAGSIKHPRDAVRALSARWRNAAESMALGKPLADLTVGSPSDWPTLAPLLSSRATLLQQWADDPEVWSEL
jgi:hypothetical protein